MRGRSTRRDCASRLPHSMNDERGAHSAESTIAGVRRETKRKTARRRSAAPGVTFADPHGARCRSAARLLRLGPLLHLLPLLALLHLLRLLRLGAFVLFRLVG